MAELVTHETTSRAAEQRGPEAPVALLSYRTRLSRLLLVRGCAAIVLGARTTTLRVLLLLGMIGRVAAIMGRVLALLGLWGVALATMLIIRSWVLAVLGLTILGLTVRLLALWRGKLAIYGCGTSARGEWSLSAVRLGFM
jgi:hypothetical protein